MDPATIIFAAGLPIALMSVPIFAIWIKHREKIAELAESRTAATNRELEARLHNLERIVTEKGYDVASQIEALREPRRAEGLVQHRSREEASR
jgi:hypothetical protein